MNPVAPLPLGRAVSLGGTISSFTDAGAASTAACVIVLNARFRTRERLCCHSTRRLGVHPLVRPVQEDVEAHRAGVRCCFDDHRPELIKDIVLIVLVTAHYEQQFRVTFPRTYGRSAASR